jgi:guanosine-3',5'-bis(diphosphate) 3'-pyrophosphohydrolase
MSEAAESTRGIRLVLKAMAFAAEKHRHQRRKDREESPYINHPIDLANILANEADVADTVVMAAAILHDTVEDTETTPEEIEREFGETIAGIVAEVTDDRRLGKDERKRLQVQHAPHASFQAQQLKLADKIANLRDIARSPPPAWSLERRQAYFSWAKQVVDGLRGRHAKLEALFDDIYQKMP